MTEVGRGRVLAVVVLFGALLACGGVESERWEPRSSSQPSSQIAKVCRRIYKGDVRQVAKAGGLPIGTLTVKASNADALEPALDSAAEYGGTHCLVTSEDDADEVGGVIAQTWGNGLTTVTPVNVHKHQVRLMVIRVPRSGWAALPTVLQPEAK